MHYGKRVILQNNVIIPSNGITFTVNSFDKATIFITGTSTSRTIVFEGSDSEGNWYPALFAKIPDLTMSSQTTGNNEVWSIDLTDWFAIRARVSAVAGGNVRVTAKVVRDNG